MHTQRTLATPMVTASGHLLERSLVDREFQAERGKSSGTSSSNQKRWDGIQVVKMRG
jgi:hypothetical protein